MIIGKKEKQRIADLEAKAQKLAELEAEFDAKHRKQLQICERFRRDDRNLTKREQSLKEWEQKLTVQKDELKQLVRAGITFQIKKLSQRPHVAESLVFKSIHSDPDMLRLHSSLSQDIQILPPITVLARIHSASGNEVYETSLNKCSCPDFKHRKFPCKHMYRLAAELGALLSFDDTELKTELQQQLQAKKNADEAEKKQQKKRR